MRHLITTLVVFTTLGLGCSSESPVNEDQNPRPESEPRVPVASVPSVPSVAKLPPAGAFVLIAADAPVFIAASDDADQIPRDPSPVDRTVRVVGITEGFVHVETLATSLQPCTPGFEFGATARIDLFVRPEALRSVLTTPKTVSFGDGTRLELAAGVPIDNTPEQAKIVIGPLELNTKLDDAEVGRWFDVIAPLELEGLDGGLASGLPLRAGPHRFQADDHYFRVGSNGDGPGLVFVNGCGRFLLQFDDSPDAKRGGYYASDGPGVVETIIAVDPEHGLDPDELAKFERHRAVLELIHAGEISSDDLQPSDCSPTEWVAPAETKLVWPGGGEAGALLTEHMFSEEPDTSAAQVCLDLAGGVELCVASSAIQSRTNELCARQRALVDARLHGGAAPTVPRVKVGKPKSSGAVDLKFIRKIVEIHANEARACYTPQLAKQRDLAGRVEISFEIGGRGKVLSSVAKSSEVGDEVATCIAKAVTRWTFLEPRDGEIATVDLSYDLSHQ